MQDAPKARDEAVDIALTTDNGMLLDGPGIRFEHDRDEQRTRNRGVDKLSSTTDAMRIARCK